MYWNAILVGSYGTLLARWTLTLDVLKCVRWQLAHWWDKRWTLTLDVLKSICFLQKAIHIMWWTLTLDVLKLYGDDQHVVIYDDEP